MVTVLTTLIVRISDFINEDRKSDKALQLIAPNINEILIKIAKIISIVKSFDLIIDENTIVIKNKIIFYKNQKGVMEYVDFYKDYKDIKEKFVKSLDKITSEPMYIFLNINIAKIISKMKENQFIFYFEKSIIFNNERLNFVPEFDQIKSKFDDLVAIVNELSKIFKNKIYTIEEYICQNDDEIGNHKYIIEQKRKLVIEGGANEIFYKNLKVGYTRFNNIVYRIN